ncbi:MAG TPA: alkaline phosphatase family protein [Actinophytocola sp.]|uniref:alkaline phosphatase family protein n=1 Tax=Actinophytocola sp. TaxID=1872138 RepID=UPI002DB99D60|nr:alkaline phosphatase family protein [Actinophytocola sp.]HEU5469380.1 alkaline phosphatase family protein [Actinophytocola sp.]
MTNAHPAPRALIIGIDGGDFAAIDPLVEQDLLPNIAGLLRRGASASTMCTWPAHTAPGWSTFVSASKPGGHGIYQFFDTQDPGYGARITTADALGRSSVWDWLAAQGYTLGLVNIPMSHPPADLPGYQVSWPLEHTTRYCRPRSLLGELAKAGAHFQSDLATMFRGDYGYLYEAEANVAARARSMSHLLRTHPTDLAMVVFTEVDRVGHHYWHYIDPAHPRHEAAPRDSGFDAALRRAYVAVDEAIGELLALVDEDTVVVLVSDHGLGIGRYALSVHSLLADAGLLATRPAGSGSGIASWFAGDGVEVDFTRTRAYLPVPGSYGINVNLRGRQRDGTVDESERDAVLDEVAELLRGVRLPDGGGPVVRDVIPREVAYPGPHTESAPDLLVVPRDESVLLVPDLDGGPWKPSWQTGLHRYAGLWAQVSPNVRPGRLRAPVGLTSAVPTLLADLGARWPDTVHGTPVRAALSSDVDIAVPDPSLDGEAFRVRETVPAGESTEDEYTSDRLREMGYI